MRISDWSSDVCSSDLLWRECRAAPARSPKRLSRLEHHREFVADGSADAVLSRGAEFLRRRRYRVVLEDTEVRAEKGYLREVGNLDFHLSLLVLLVGVALGKLFGFEGGAAIAGRSEERRVGKEGVRKCSSRGEAY